MQKKILIGNIQRFCVNDGDGIRTTIFLKGCNIRCPWCANPENQIASIQRFRENSVIKSFGSFMSEQDILNKVLKDKLYYKDGGGVTYSGGEPLLSLYLLKNVIQELKCQGISQWIETSLFAPQKDLEFAINYMDNFIVDMKNICIEQCRKYLGGDSNLYLENFHKVINTHPDLIVRIPAIEPYTYNDQNNTMMISELENYPKIKIQIFKVHNLGVSKYKLLNRKYSIMEEICDDKLIDLYNRLKEKHKQVEIIAL